MRLASIRPIYYLGIVLGLVQVFTACGGGGGNNSGAAGGAPPINSSRYAYVANYNDNSVSSYRVDATTGALSQNGYVAAANNPTAIAIDPTGRFVYVANLNSGSLIAYRINAATGTLTKILCGGGVGCTASSVPLNDFSTGAYPYSVAVDPSGKFAYVASVSGVAIHSIDATTGALTLIPCGGGAGCSGAYYLAGSAPTYVAIEHTGKFAYVSNWNSPDISAFTINASTGALTQVLCGGGADCNGDNYLAGAKPASITVDPSGRFAYATNVNSPDADVSAYTINTSTGSLTPILCGGGTGCHGNHFMAGIEPSFITVDPSGRFAYVANYGSTDISAYTINASTGFLTPILCGGGVGCHGDNFLAGGHPQSVTVDPTGKFAYVTNVSSNDISAYTINPTTGALTALSTITGRNGNIAMAITP